MLEQGWGCDTVSVHGDTGSIPCVRVCDGEFVSVRMWVCACGVLCLWVLVGLLRMFIVVFV